MRWRVFVTYNLVGAAAWSATATLLGWGLGKHFPKIENYLTPVLALIVVLSVLPMLLELRKARRARILQPAP